MTGARPAGGAAWTGGLDRALLEGHPAGGAAWRERLSRGQSLLSRARPTSHLGGACGTLGLVLLVPWAGSSENWVGLVPWAGSIGLAYHKLRVSNWLNT